MSGREYFSKVWPRELKQLAEILDIVDQVPHIAYVPDMAWYHCKAIFDVDAETSHLSEKLMNGTIKKEEAEQFAKFMIPPTINIDYDSLCESAYEDILVCLKHICRAFRSE